jgi:hypothetical protein
MKRATTVALIAYAALLALSAPPWPDDWDGLGFVASETRFDMDHFAPHPPGYPVYVALLRLAHLVLRNGVTAASTVAVASGVATVCLAWSAAGHALVPSARLPVALAVALPPLAWRADAAVGSEAPALAFAALAAWALASPASPRTRAAVLGVAVGLGLGVRLSWAPLFVPMLALAPRGGRARAVATAAGATLAWAVPLVAVVGPGHLVALFRAHFAGHAERWGGTVVTDPGVHRAVYLARDVAVDGLGGGSDPLGLAILAVASLVAAVGVMEWRRARWAFAREAALVLGPYLAWIALGQNLAQQPRHALPLVVALAVGLALSIHSSGRGVVGFALALLLGFRTAQDAWDRRTTPPAAAQVVAWVRGLPDGERVAVFGTTSTRFFEQTELADRAAYAATVGDVRVALGRMSGVPSRVFVTGEVDARGAVPPARHVGTFCRPERLDRRAPCLELYDWRPSFLP